MSTSPVARVLEWLKAGYPQGIPPADYPPVLGVLRRKLTDEEIEAISDELALQSVSAGDVPVTADDIRNMVREHVFQRRVRHPDTAGTVEGRGLGLHISRALALANGGDLRLADKPTGSRFELVLQQAER